MFRVQLPPAGGEIGFPVEIGEHVLKAVDGEHGRGQQVSVHDETELGRGPGDHGKGDVARKILAGIGERVAAIELPQRHRGGPLQFQQVRAQRQAAGHLAERAFVSVKSRGIERAHGVENLLVRLDAHAGITGRSGRLSRRNLAESKRRTERREGSQRQHQSTHSRSFLYGEYLNPQKFSGSSLPGAAYKQTLTGRSSGVKNRTREGDRAGAGLRRVAGNLIRSSSVDVNFTEAQKNMAASHGQSEAQFRPELGKQQHLVDLVLNGGIVGPRENFIEHHLPLRIHRRFEQQRAGIGMALRGNDAGHGEGRETFQLGRLHQVERQIVGDHSAGWNADEDVLNHEHKNRQSREESAGGGYGQRLEDILEGQPGAGSEAPRLSHAESMCDG